MTSAEAHVRLLAALRRERAGWKILTNPFDRCPTRAVWTLAVAVLFVCLGLSQLGFRFDGALDIHRIDGVPPWRIAIFDQVNAVVLTAAVAWLVSLAAARRGRFVDFAMTIGAARVPLVFLALSNYWLMPPTSQLQAMVKSGTAPGLGLVLAALVSLPFFGWFLVLLYRGFVVSSGLKGDRAGFAFGLGVIIAEALSKVTLTLAR